jgi:hypothetical protein
MTAAAQLALGRILRLAARSTQPGDVEEYERCRAIILEDCVGVPLGYTPNWARDRHKGASGD